MAQRKRREKSAREHADRYRSFFEHALEGIFRSTPEGRFVEVNPALVRMLGYQSAEEVQRSSFLMISMWTRRNVHTCAPATSLRG